MVRQLVSVLQERMSVTALKAEEIVCFNLKEESRMYQRRDVIVKGQPHFLAETDLAVTQVDPDGTRSCFEPPPMAGNDSTSYRACWRHSSRVVDITF